MILGLRLRGTGSGLGWLRVSTHTLAKQAQSLRL